MAKVTVVDFLDSVGQWTTIEVAEAVKGLQDKFGIQPMAAAAPAAAAGAGAAAAEEKTEFSAMLVSSGDKKIQVIKVVREITGLGLKEAKDLVEGAPKPVKEGLTKAQAEDIKKKLTEQGATVEIR